MYMSGFADEAAVDLDGQIRATRELGWRYLEARNVGGVNFHDLPDAEFDAVCAKLEEAGIRINCFGSTIANWGKKITDPIDADLEQTERAIVRMKRLGVEMVRIMSYAVIAERSPEDQLFEERVERLKRIVGKFLDAGLQPVHENCMNYGGMGWSYTMRLLEEVPGMKLVFDTGNPVFTDDRTKPMPFPKQSAWEFYKYVREDIVHIHIKDGSIVNGKVEYRWPGEGDGDVRKICVDLVKTGFDGCISIEPHLKAVFHDENVKSDEEARFSTYVEYGRRMEAILKEAGATLQKGR